MTSDFIKQGEVIRAADIIAAFDEKAPVETTPSGTTESSTIPANNSNSLTSILQTIINNLRWIFNSNNIARKNYVDGRFNEIALSMYPVGSIYMSVNSTNPGSLFGGTWTAWGQGRAIVGVNTTGTFNTVEKMGGEENVTLTTAEMPRHTHIQNQHRHDIPHYNDLMGGGSYSATRPDADFSKPTLTSYTTATNQYTGGSGTSQSASNGVAHNNIQPYITCYFFKRTN